MTNICSIMQPTYLPWAGYFNLILRADTFFFLDDVQFEKGSWHQRNRILLAGKPYFLTVPVNRFCLGQLINEVAVDSLRGNWRRKHIQSLTHAYCKKPYFHLIEPLFDLISNEEINSICELNIALISKICEIIELPANFQRSSDFNVSSTRSGKLIELCRASDSLVYLSPAGAFDYLTKDKFTSQSSIELVYQDYPCAEYEQNAGSDFVSHMSIIDVIVNLGVQGTYQYIDSN